MFSGQYISSYENEPSFYTISHLYLCIFWVVSSKCAPLYCCKPSGIATLPPTLHPPQCDFFACKKGHIYALGQEGKHDLKMTTFTKDSTLKLKKEKNSQGKGKKKSALKHFGMRARAFIFLSRKSFTKCG